MTGDFSDWIGKTETLTDRLDPARCNALIAALGAPLVLAEGDAMPLLHHWLHFWNVQPPASLGSDGHPAKGGFLPPVPLPRRMWAGGRLKFERPLHLGERIEKVSAIRKIEAKSGKSGELVFVTLEHRISGEDGLAVIEEQDLVYREPATGPAPSPATDAGAPPCQWHRTIAPDEVLLFRYSALTMNGHRIHYDLPYAQGEEAYPALVVHGPLQATCLAAMAQRELGGTLRTFDFRAVSPAYAGQTLHICGEKTDEGAKVWSVQGGATCVSATAS